MTAITGTRADRLRRRWLGLALFALASFVAAAVGGLGVAGGAGEYRSLSQPGWAPPSWLFGPVWTVLYSLMAVSAWLVWLRVGVRREVWACLVQLLLNAIWTPLFFGFGQYGLALVDIVGLLVAIVASIGLFWRVSIPAPCFSCHTRCGSPLRWHLMRRSGWPTVDVLRRLPRSGGETVAAGDSAFGTLTRPVQNFSHAGTWPRIA